MIKLDNMRRIDFYTKGLPEENRKVVFQKLDDINPVSVSRIIEKPDDYPAFRRMGFSDDDINDYVLRMVAKFDDLNNYMMENNRYPLFSNAKDSYKSAVEYVDILQVIPMEQLVKEFGTDYEHYVPREYRPSQSHDEL